MTAWAILAVSQRILKRLRGIEKDPLRAMKRLTGSKDFAGRQEPNGIERAARQ